MTDDTGEPRFGRRIIGGLPIGPANRVRVFSQDGSLRAGGALGTGKTPGG